MKLKELSGQFKPVGYIAIGMDGKEQPATFAHTMNAARFKFAEMNGDGLHTWKSWESRGCRVDPVYLHVFRGGRR